MGHCSMASGVMQAGRLTQASALAGAGPSVTTARGWPCSCWLSGGEAGAPSPQNPI